MILIIAKSVLRTWETRKLMQPYERSSRVCTEQKYAPRPRTHTYSPIFVNGLQIIDMSKRQPYIDDLTRHRTQCTGTVTLSGELRDGLTSVMKTKCYACNHAVVLKTSEIVKGL